MPIMHCKEADPNHQDHRSMLPTMGPLHFPFYWNHEDLSSSSRSNGERTYGLTPLLVGQTKNPPEVGSVSSHSFWSMMPSFHQIHLMNFMGMNNSEVTKHLDLAITSF